jgi:hypothetical protein
MLADGGDDVVAMRLAEQASVDAQLAAAKGATGKSKEAMAQLRDSASTLREEVNRPDASAPAGEPKP